MFTTHHKTSKSLNYSSFLMPNHPIVNNVIYHFNVHWFKCVVYFFSSFSFLLDLPFRQSSKMNEIRASKIPPPSIMNPVLSLLLVESIKIVEKYEGRTIFVVNFLSSVFHSSASSPKKTSISKSMEKNLLVCSNNPSMIGKIQIKKTTPHVLK